MNTSDSHPLQVIPKIDYDYWLIHFVIGKLNVYT